MNCILSRAITYHYQGRCPPHKRGSFALFHLFGINSGLFQVVLSFPSLPNLLWLVTNYSRLLHLLQTTIYKMFWLANLQKINFMLDIVTNGASGITKKGRYYRMVQFLLQNERGSIPKWGNHYKKEKDSTKGFWQLIFKATLSESKTCNRNNLRGDVVSNWWTMFKVTVFLKKNSVNTKYLKK